MLETTDRIEEDYEYIMDQFFDPYNNYISEYNKRKPLEMWKKNKESLYKLFGEKMIITKTIQSSETEWEKEEFINEVDVILSQYPVVENRVLTRMAIATLITERNFNSNKINEIVDDYFIHNDLKASIKIGMKLNKAFGNIIRFHRSRDIDQEKVEMVVKEIQSLYSRKRQRFLNSQKTFKLHLSIHPLDYLSVSNNTSNWDTCQTIGGDSEWAAGVFSFLGDTTTIVAYLTNDEEDPFQCDTFDVQDEILWNDKKWRQYVHTKSEGDKTAVFYNRQYPFTSPSFTHEVDVMMAELYLNQGIQLMSMEKVVTEPFLENLLDKKSEDWHGFGNILMDESPISFNTMAIGYNDTINIKCGVGFSSTLGYEASDFAYFLPVGGENHCLYCGNIIVGLDEARNLVCMDCDQDSGKMWCEVCESYESEENMYFTSDGIAICSDCVQKKEYAFCDICGELLHIDSMEENDITAEVICESCNSVRIRLPLRIRDVSTTEKAYTGEHLYYGVHSLDVYIANSKSDEIANPNHNIHEHVFTDDENIITEIEKNNFVSIADIAVITGTIDRAIEIVKKIASQKRRVEYYSSIDIKLQNQLLSDCTEDKIKELYTPGINTYLTGSGSDRHLVENNV